MASLFGRGLEFLRLSALKNVDQICLDFEAAWKSGQRPRIETYLVRAKKAEHQELLTQLLLLELDYRDCASDAPAPEEYIERFPGEEALIRNAFTVHAGGESRSNSDATLTCPSNPSHVDAGRDSSASLDRMGRYQIQQKLGHGRFGEVFLGWDEELRRLVAVKIPHRERFLTAEDHARFLNEAGTAARLKHPGIIPIHDIGRQPDGTPFVVMQYMPGKTLEEVLGSQRLSPRRAAQLILEIAEAIHYAHRKGIVHRDLKPSNIVMDDDDRPCIADFGVAERWGPKDPDSTPAQVEIAGTAAFIPPEVYQRRARISPAIDIYALGVIMYKALTGSYPFAGKTWDEIRAAVIQGAPPLPNDLDPEVPEPLQRICLKAMEADPEGRYASAEAMADELRRFLEGRTVFARPKRYHQEIRGRLRNHCTEIRAWREENLLNIVQMDRLLRPYLFILGEDSPWIGLSRLFPWETVIVRLGGCLVLLSSCLWLGLYWSQLDSALARVLSVGLPMLALNLVGWVFFSWRSAWNARIFLGIGALLLPLTTAVILGELEWSRFYQSPERELFSPEAHRDNPNYIMPTNTQITWCSAVFVAYAILLVRKTRGQLLVVWLGLGIVMLFTGCLLLLGLKQWLTEDEKHIAWTLTCYLMLVAGLGGAAILWAYRGSRELARLLYPFFPVPAALLLTGLAWYGCKEWFDVFEEKNPLKTECINVWWMFNGVFYYAAARLAFSSSFGFVRFWSAWFYALVPLSLLLPLNILFGEGITLLPSFGDQPLKTYELASFLCAIGLIVWGTIVSRATFSVPGLVALAVCVFRVAHAHFADEVSWPLALALGGAAAMAVGVASAFVRSLLRQRAERLPSPEAAADLGSSESRASARP